MGGIVQELPALYEALKAGKVSIQNAWGGEYADRIVHIEIDKTDPQKFAYRALSNEGLNDPEKYLTIEERKGVSRAVLLEIVYRLLTPQ